MERKRGTPGKRDEAREDRLKAALKSNLARRKAQAKARARHDDNDNKTTEQNEDS
ncbi:hypothetical protein OCH239_02535 [Roseivivax halodurans JCM 10272]|uniref:Uncharacterized protein n=1 Tax=Roseivivax halodurans JCM 10272 TaxID=1449350 RepID=X7EF35_9RHOB|nr:hypothetical protein [Roseivivax halodurans]ETX14460.1 hypothetical protein OCH239_02535 [Roseivivax halodurans JCM 10272]